MDFVYFRNILHDNPVCSHDLLRSEVLESVGVVDEATFV